MPWVPYMNVGDPLNFFFSVFMCVMSAFFSRWYLFIIFYSHSLLCVRITPRAIKRRILERRGYVRALVALATIEDNRLTVSYNYVLAASTSFFTLIVLNCFMVLLMASDDKQMNDIFR